MDNLNNDNVPLGTLQEIISVEYLEDRAEVLEQVMDVLLETSQGLVLSDKSEYLRLVAEVRTSIKDCRMIAKSLNKISFGNEQQE